MPISSIHRCQCSACQHSEPSNEQQLHQKMNVLLSRLDEQQRRWYVAVESSRVGHGGDRLLSLITGIDEKTIRRGRQEMADSLTERPQERVRLTGGGRPAAQKKTPPS